MHFLSTVTSARIGELNGFELDAGGVVGDGVVAALVMTVRVSRVGLIPFGS